MGGENSKNSGEVGETIATKLLTQLGWVLTLNNIPIKCNDSSHVNKDGNSRKSHGEDKIYIYHNPFHDDTSEIVHISVKHTQQSYPTDTTLKTKIKEYLAELQQTIDCAKYSPELKGATSAHGMRKNKNHSGLLIWISSADHDRDIKPTLANLRIDDTNQHPIYLIDNARAFFLSHVIKYAKANLTNQADFFYPPIGTTISATESRTGTFLPLELIASDIIPILGQRGGVTELIFLANQKFSVNSYTKLLSYALQFSSGLVANIKIGMPDFNASYHENEAKTARMKFSDRPENITPFCYIETILNSAK